jgi:hypothetical protein
MPRAFFECSVKPAWRDWLANPLEEWRAKSAVHNANVMAERLFRYWHPRNPALTYGCDSPGAYRRELVARECRDFQLVWDIDDAHKHLAITRLSAVVSHSSQTGVGQIGYGMGGYGEGVYGGGDQIVVTLDNGAVRALSAVLAEVIEMWERLLVRMGL